MKIWFFAVYLVSVFQTSMVFCSVEAALQRSLDKALECLQHEPSKEPVMAMTPARFAQLVAMLRKKSEGKACGKSRSSFPFNIEDPVTWPFCVLGSCERGKCKCVASYTGSNCGTYSKKCWLMYCFLTSCHPAFQSIYCKCDPKLYGKKVLTGEYWYADGLRNSYEPPPPGWIDELDENEFAKIHPKNKEVLNQPTGAQTYGRKSALKTSSKQSPNANWKTQEGIIGNQKSAVLNPEYGLQGGQSGQAYEFPNKASSANMRNQEIIKDQNPDSLNSEYGLEGGQSGQAYGRPTGTRTGPGSSDIGGILNDIEPVGGLANGGLGGLVSNEESAIERQAARKEFEEEDVGQVSTPEPPVKSSSSSLTDHEWWIVKYIVLISVLWQLLIEIFGC